MTIEALVIKKMPTREHDKLVTLYCRELGKTIAVARSVNKAHSVQALQLDEGNLIRCELVPGAGSAIITGAQALQCRSSAKSSLVRWAAAQFFLQVVDTIVYDHQQDDALFTCLADTLQELDTVGDEAALAVFRRRQGELLQVLGYGHPVQTGLTRGRTATDDTYERIAQRRLGSLDLFYELVNSVVSC